MSEKVKKKHPVLRFFRNLLIILILIILAAYLATAYIIRGQFGRGDYPDRRLTTWYWYDDFADSYPRELVTFQSGDNRLIGYIYGADNNDKGLLVWAHGIGSGHEAYISDILWFVDQGWKVFAYDATGSGDSEGSGSRGLVQSALDLDSALTFAEHDDRLSGLPVMLFGHSWGGYAVAAVQDFGHRINAAVSVSGYNNAFEMLTDGADDVIGEIPAMIDKPFMWVWNRLTFGKYADLTALDGINKGSVPILIMHGDQDKVVGYDTISIISKKQQITNPNAEYYVFTGEYAGHSSIFNSDDANAYIKEVNARWKEVTDRYNGDPIPDDVQEAFVATVDKEKCNVPNPVLLEKAEEFLEKNLNN